MSSIISKLIFSSIICTAFATLHGDYSKTTVEFIEKFKIPLIRTMLETYGAVVNIARIEVKINLETPWKVAKAVQMIEENINLDMILDKLRY